MVVGVAAGAAGYPWAPLPIVDVDEKYLDPDTGRPEDARKTAVRDAGGGKAVDITEGADTANKAVRLRLAAPLTLAGIALVLFLESAWTRTPLTQSWAVAALIMCASLLLPVGPLDGAHLGKAGVAVSAGVIGTALLFGLGLL